MSSGAGAAGRNRGEASATAAALGWGVPQLYAKGETPRLGRILDPTKGRGSLRHVAPALAPPQQAASAVPWCNGKTNHAKNKIAGRIMPFSASNA